MYTIVQLSDLHFGKTDYEVVNTLIPFVRSLQPNLIAVSGDLTLRARRAEFLQASKFLSLLPQPQIIVPGNHDIPFYNLWHRLVKPHFLFSQNVSGSLEPFYQDKYVAVLGLNTTFPMLGQAGRLQKKQLGQIKEKLNSVTPGVLKILLTHHPLNKIWALHKGLPLFSQRSLVKLIENRVDIFMSGHLHKSASRLVNFNPSGGHTALLLEAGTATSIRFRGEVNAFNVITLDNFLITVIRYAWDPELKTFVKVLSEKFTKGPLGLSQV